MSTIKINLSLYFILVLLFHGKEINSEPHPMIGRVVQISAAALESVLGVYDQTIVLLTNDIQQEHTKMFENSIKNMISSKEIPNINKTLFAICDLTKDVSGRLKKYGSNGIVLINEITHDNLPFPSNQSDIPTYFSHIFPQFFFQHLPSNINQILLHQIKQKAPYNSGYTIIAFTDNEQSITKISAIYYKIFNWLKFFQVNFVICQHLVNYTQIVLYLDGEIQLKYPKSAVQSLINYEDEPSKQNLNELINWINVETIDDVTLLENSNFIRVFGSIIESQLLFIYSQKNKDNQQIKKIREHFKNASTANRKQGLKYQRVLFAQSTTEFLQAYFQENLISNDTKLYKLILTQPDLQKFQMRKFIYSGEDIDSQKIIEFISDVRMKKISADYESQEEIDNENRKIKKIVGSNFEKQIYEQRDKSVLVLFIDSKDQNSSQAATSALQNFTQVYYDKMKDQISVGIFDLAKNQHRLLTMTSAPQLLLFQKANKKIPKTFEGEITFENIKKWLVFQLKALTSSQSDVQPPKFLGFDGNSQQL